MRKRSGVSTHAAKNRCSGSSAPLRDRRSGPRKADLSENHRNACSPYTGIPVTREALPRPVSEAKSAAERIGYPVALKVQSSDIAHKTEARAVRLGVRDAAESVKAVYEDVLANARAYRSEATIDGVLVQEMVDGGIEVILGVTNDASFGPAVMFGLGGIFAEVLHDVTFRLALVTAASAREMIDEIKGYPLLTGVPGKPPADVDALADAIVRLSCARDGSRGFPLAESMSIRCSSWNSGRGVVAADALVKVKSVKCEM